MDKTAGGWGGGPGGDGTSNGNGTGGSDNNPNNQQNQDNQQNQVENCLHGVYDTPDGKLYDAFSLASPFIGSDTGFNEAAKEIGKEGGWQFVKKRPRI